MQTLLLIAHKKTNTHRFYLFVLACNAHFLSIQGNVKQLRKHNSCTTLLNFWFVELYEQNDRLTSVVVMFFRDDGMYQKNTNKHTDLAFLQKDPNYSGRRTVSGEKFYLPGDAAGRGRCWARIAASAKVEGGKSHPCRLECIFLSLQRRVL